VPVSDLKPILKMPLTFLVLSGTEVRDVTALKDLPLERVVLPKRTGVKGVEALKDVRTLREIGYEPDGRGQTPETFWKSFQVEK
jgi:hypothetical protein